MSLHDEETPEEKAKIEDDENEYLADPQKGLELISKILPLKKYQFEKMNKVRYVDKLMDKHLVNIIGKIALDDELEYYKQLTLLSDKITSIHKFRLLKEKTVIGVGGRFSAGKSAFINSLLNLDEAILPEAQNPTTSIPTYIVKSEVDEIFAHTFDNQEVEIDLEGMKALTHAFSKQYKLGFSKIITNLAIKSKDMLFENIAFLDTPGYNKADSGTLKENTDDHKAISSLTAIDFLIWLIDSENGGVVQKDIEFMKKINLLNPILIVLNKADKTKPNILDILAKSKTTIKNSGIKCFGITAYSSREGKEYINKPILNNFMKLVVNHENRLEDAEKIFSCLISQINDELEKELKNSEEKINETGNAIFQSKDILNLRALAGIYSLQSNHNNEIIIAKNHLKRKTDQISEILKEIM